MRDRRQKDTPRRASHVYRFAARIETLERRELLATLVVNTTGDGNDPTADTLSLREAIEVSNGTLAVSSLSASAQALISGTFLSTSPNDIVFSLSEPAAPASTVIQKITLNSPLPAITLPANIDGYTESRSYGNAPTHTDYDDADALIQIDGGQIPSATYPSTDGIAIQAANCQVNGVIISGFTHAGISISGAGSQGNFIWGNFIGALPDPTTGNNYASASNPGAGILVESSNNNVGGNNPGLRNIIAYNGVGVRIDTPFGTGNLIQNNFILQNINQGVYVTSSNNVIGEALTGGGNVISGNGAQGVWIQNPAGGSNVQGNQVLGNEIGTGLGNIAGTITRGETAFGNGAEAVLIDNSPKNQIGGSVAAARNILAASVGDGLVIRGALATNNQVLGNYVGFNITPAGLEAILPNQNGITVESPNNIIGGSAAGAGNVIDLNRADGILITGANLAVGDPPVTNTLVQGNIVGLNPGAGTDFGNTLDGIHIIASAANIIGGTTAGARNVVSGNNNGVVLDGAGATGNLVEGNFIGTALDGETPLGNAVDGIIINGAPLNTIGGLASGAGNVISGNNYGLIITGPGAANNLIQGNFIGTDLAAKAIINNQVDGINVNNFASNNMIGGLAAGAGNTIIDNAGSGVSIVSGTSNAILSNSIDNNNLLGIMLGASGTGNKLQAAPTLISAAPNGNGTNVQGTFSALPNTAYTIQFFSSPSKDPLGTGEGGALVDTVTLTTDASGNANFNLDLPTAVSAGRFITATATDPQNNTSAFSNAVPAVLVQFALTSATYTATESDGSVTISVTRLGGQGGQAAVNFATSAGTAAAGVDYTDVSGTLFFNPGDPATKTFTIPILNPQKVGGSVTVNIGLSNPANGSTLASPSSALLTINGSIPTDVQLQTASTSVNESAGTLVVTVLRNTNLGTSTVNYSTIDGTAVGGKNFTATTGTVTFNPGDTSKTITIPILDDGVITAPLHFTLNLSSPTGTILGSNTATVVTVNNTDAISSVQFGSANPVAAAGASFGVFTIQRAGDARGSVHVQLSTQGGTAVAGVNYTPLSLNLVFGPGETSKTLRLPLLTTNNSGSDLTVGLVLSNPVGNTVLGSVATATLTLQHASESSNPTDTVPPVVTELRPILGPEGIVAVVVGFSKPMDPTRATNPAGYGFFINSAGIDGSLSPGNTSTAISYVEYFTDTREATIHLASPLALGSFYQVVFNRDSSPLSTTNLVDTSGNLLAGDGSNAGTPYVSILGEGPYLSYYDNRGNMVNLKLQGPGEIILHRGSDGTAQVLQLVGTAPGQTTLSGSVRRRGRRFAQTIIPSIVGAYGVKIRLRRNSFFIGGIQG